MTPEKFGAHLQDKLSKKDHGTASELLEAISGAVKEQKDEVLAKKLTALEDLLHKQDDADDLLKKYKEYTLTLEETKQKLAKVQEEVKENEKATETAEITPEATQDTSTPDASLDGEQSSGDMSGATQGTSSASG